MKRHFSVAVAIVAVLSLLAGAASARAQCPFAMRSQVQMQMQWQMQMQSQQYNINWQQQAMMQAQMQMRMQPRFNFNMFNQRACFPQQNFAQFQNMHAQQFMHTFRPTLNLHQVTTAMPRFNLQRQNLTSHLLQLRMTVPFGHGGVARPNLFLTQHAVPQHRFVPAVHFQPRTNLLATPRLGHTAGIVRVGLQRPNTIWRPGAQTNNTLMRVAAGARTNALMRVNRTPPARFQQRITNNIQHRASVKLRITTTMTCGNCHMTPPNRPTLVLAPPRFPDLAAMVPPMVPDIARRRPPVVNVPVVLPPVVNVPQLPALARVPLADPAAVVRIPARNPDLARTASPKDDRPTLSRTPALPSLSSTSSSPSMRTTSPTGSPKPKNTTPSAEGTDMSQPPELPPLAGEITQTTFRRSSDAAPPRATAPKDEALLPADLKHPPALPSLTPPPPSIPVAVTVGRPRAPSLAEVLSQPPALPALRP
jgi:hypothetical protein